MKHSESILQRSIVKYFRYQFPELKYLFFAIPNGGYRNIIEARIMKGEGVVSGVADLFLSVSRGTCHGVYFELKVGKNTLTENQQEFKNAVINQGFAFHTIRSLDQFIIVVGNYLKGH